MVAVPFSYHDYRLVIIFTIICKIFKAVKYFGRVKLGSHYTGQQPLEPQSHLRGPGAGYTGLYHPVSRSITDLEKNVSSPEETFFIYACYLCLTKLAPLLYKKQHGVYF
jgi:hypothetical protein